MQQRRPRRRRPATTRRPGRWPPARPRPTSVLADLAFAWRACRAVKSNAILLARDGASVGVGMGQVNRVDSCRLAVARAGDRAAGSVAASDAFFPFADGPQILIDAGVARDRPARRLGPRRAEVVEAAEGRRRDACTSPAPATSSTDSPGPGDDPRDRRTDPRRHRHRSADDQGASSAEARRRSAQASAASTPGPRHGAGRRRPGLAVVRRRASTRTAPRSASTSIRRDLPATATQAEVEAVIDELNADPACTGFIVQQPLPGLDEIALLSRGRPGQGRRRPAPDQPRQAGARASAARCRARRSASSSCCAATTCRSRAPRWSWSAAGSPSGRPLGLLLTRRTRERHRDPVPHRHP